MELLTAKDKKVYLIRFVNGIARYHRDFDNFNIFNEAMERINLASELPELTEQLRVMLEQHLEAQKTLAEQYPSLVTEEDEVDDRHIEELKALGYVQ